MNIGSKLFEFELKDVKGNTHKPVAEYHSSAILVAFFSSNCEICQAYTKRLENLAVRFENDQLAIYVIDINTSGAYTMEEHFTDLRLLSNHNFVHLVDENAEIAKAFGAKKAPEVFLFNQNRELVYRGLIDDNWKYPDFVTRVYLEDAIDYTLDGMEYDFPETEPVGSDIL